jgi:hypothetical protein
MACPICISPEGSQLSAGLSAGAATLIVVTLVVIAPIVRFAWKIWRLEAGQR